MLRFFRDVPIRRKLTLLLLLASVSGVLLTGIGLAGYAWASRRAAIERDLASVSSILANNATAALAFRDAATANEILSAMQAKPELETGCLYVAEGLESPKPFARYSTTEFGCPPEPGPPGVRVERAGLVSVQPVVQAGERIGWLRLQSSLKPLERALLAQAGIMLGIVGFAIAVSIGIALAMQRVFASPILRLAQAAREVSETRNYGLRVQAYGHDEVGGLVQDFNAMLGQIARADFEIKQLNQSLEQQVTETARTNNELEIAISRLKEAQMQLVQAEKMASLGALVAGIAHEINTPVGVGVTAASTLQTRAGELRQQYQREELRRSDLERFVALAEESTQIILRNLQRAADLIHSFKQVAVDQSSGERRRFGLKAYIDEILLSLRPRLKKTAHTVEVDCPDDLVLDSFPGAIAQILTNFVTNSLLHAFDGIEHGHIRITVKREHDRVSLRYGDDGRGISPEHLGRIFDPFFTTKRGVGGSGLGLHIVYNLVTQLLGGTIHVASELGRGAQFTIVLPAQEQRAAA
jgi:signal transduction histidine kinase